MKQTIEYGYDTVEELRMEYQRGYDKMEMSQMILGAVVAMFIQSEQDKGVRFISKNKYDRYIVMRMRQKIKLTCDSLMGEGKCSGTLLFVLTQ